MIKDLWYGGFGLKIPKHLVSKWLTDNFDYETEIKPAFREQIEREGQNDEQQ